MSHVCSGGGLCVQCSCHHRTQCLTPSDTVRLSQELYGDDLRDLLSPAVPGDKPLSIREDERLGLQVCAHRCGLIG